MLRVGLLGAGRIGGVHARSISSNSASELVAVSDVFEENAKSIANSYGCEVRGSQEIIDDSSIDAVLIASSTDTHSDLIEAAAEKGKAVLCEKPVDLSLERAQACLSNVGDQASKIMIGFNRRFDPSFGLLKSSVDGGEIGQSELLSITSFDPAPPPINYIEVSGGLFRDMMIHDFDMANFIFNGLPVTVSAVGTTLVDPAIGKAGDVDTAVVTLTYDDGRIAVIKNSRRAVYGYDQRVEVLGSEGLLQAENVLENTVVKSTESGVSSAKPTYFFLERYYPAYAAEWAAFVSAVEADESMPVDLNDGVMALAMAEAATMSSQSAGKPVELKELVKI